MCVNGLLLLSVYFLFKISEHIVIEKIRNGYLESVAELFQSYYTDIFGFHIDYIVYGRLGNSRKSCQLVYGYVFIPA